MNIGIIGIGKIAAAMIEGWCTQQVLKVDINLSPRNAEISTQLATKYANVKKLNDNQAVLDQSDLIILAVRPAMAAEVLGTLRFSPHHQIVSVIPLLKEADLRPLVAPATEISRAIPLPPVRYHQCPIPIYHITPGVTRLFSSIGQPLFVEDERQLHAIWTLTGLITPFYELLGQLSGWTEQHGVSKATATAYTAHLFQSLAGLAQQSLTIDFEELSAHAATPNGMNEQAGREIRESGAYTPWIAAADHLLQRFEP